MRRAATPSSARDPVVGPPSAGKPRWWLLAVGAVYLGYFGLLVFFEVWGLQRIRWFLDARTGAVFVAGVPAQPAGDPAALRPGDRILSVGQLPMHDVLDWAVAVAHFQPGRPVELGVEREGRRISTTLVPAWAGQGDLDWQAVLVLSFFRLPAMVMAVVLAWLRPREPQALASAWLMATFATVTDVPGPGMAAAWRGLPTALAALAWIPYTAGLASAAIVFTFVAVFPRTVLHGARSWAIAWAPALASIAWQSPVLWRVALDARTSVGDLQHVQKAMPVSGAYLLASLVTLGVSYRRLTDPNDRRRVRIVLVGALIAILPSFAFFAVGNPSPARITSTAARLIGVLGAAFPLSLTYAVLRHRLFDIRLIVRAGVRYAVARRVLLLLVPVLLGLLVADLLGHGNRPLVTVLAERGWVYVSLGALALVAHRRRERWLDALDRRFFRERYDATRLLRDVVKEIGGQKSLADAAPPVVASIAAALHPEFAALFEGAPGASELAAVAVAPPSCELQPWPEDSRLLGLLQVLNVPLDVESTRAGGLLEGLPPGEMERLERSGFDLVVPIRSPPGAAFLALGRKRSAEPYAREERELLQAIATGLRLLPHRAASRETPEPIWPALGSRYRIVRPLGEGGMGVVYEGTDATLGRRVAVKLLREDRAWRGDAADRFRREGRALAALAHPNVVTIHDFGVSSDGRLFLVMEFLVGPTLRHLLLQGRIPAPRSLDILDGIAAAVGAAHRARIVHRDLKPENVILAVGEAGEVTKVLDFGLAKLLSTGSGSRADTATHGVVGTLLYMAPEQMAGGVVDPSWDLWALAVIAYEMLAGTHPFASGGRGDWRAAVLAGRFTPLQVCWPEAPPALDGFFSRALAAGRDRRPATAAELLAQLREALS